MSSIAVITDTDASLPAEIAARHGVRQVPITIHFGDEVFETGVDMNEAQLFARIDREGKIPSTSAPAPGAFAKTFQEAFDAGAEQIICFCVSGEVSATYGAAKLAHEMMPERNIRVVDTHNLSMGQGFMVMAAAEAVQEGASAEEAIHYAQQVGERSRLFAALSTLKYLAMSGRVGHLAAGVAGLLNVMPILTIKDGKLDLLERVRTRKKAWARVIELTEASLEGRPAERMAILHVNVPQAAQQFQDQLCARLACPDTLFTGELTAGLSVHSGAGLVGVVVVKGN